MTPEIVVPDWPAPAGVQGLVTTRALGDMKTDPGRARLRRLLPSEPRWLKQAHGVNVVNAARVEPGTAADASFARESNAVCTVMVADCMPILLADECGEALSCDGIQIQAPMAGSRGLERG